MAAAVSEPGGTRSLCTLTANDEVDISWMLANAEGDVGRMRSGALERGGSFSTVDHDKMTDRQMRFARRQGRILDIRARVVLENPVHWEMLTRYWSQECARVRVERERGKPGSGDTLAPLGAADRELRLVALYPFTPSAQTAGETMAAAERLKDRARRIKAGPLRLVGATAAPEPVDGGEDSAATDVAAAPQRVKIRLDNGEVVEADETSSREILDFATSEGDFPGSLGYAVRLHAAVAGWHHRRVQGPWTPSPLAPDELRDAAVRAIRDAERRKDHVLLADIRVQAVKMYAFAQDAYVRARREVKGKDGEEKRQEKADRWAKENASRTLRAEATDFFAALESSSRIRTS